jgi:phosphohistidine swiveling domain-containing protein
VDEILGKGEMVSGGGATASPAVGRFVALLNVHDLLAVMELDDGASLIGYLEHPNVTMIAPIFDRLSGILCANGDEAAHVAIVARELGLPCAVQVVLDRDTSTLSGRNVSIRGDGVVFLLDGK